MQRDIDNKKESKRKCNFKKTYVKEFNWNKANISPISYAIYFYNHG